MARQVIRELSIGKVNPRSVLLAVAKISLAVTLSWLSVRVLVELFGSGVESQQQWLIAIFTYIYTEFIVEVKIV